MNAVKWILKDFNGCLADEISAKVSLLPLTSRLLVQRGITTAQEAERFLHLDEEIADPFLLKDMEKAVKRIEKALADGERICIYGDYDVDGITATTSMLKYLNSKGGDCDYFIPDRIDDGYGLNEEVIKRLAEDFSLIITVDTGVTAITEVELANSLGLDIIITDHHSCREELPDAVAVINPQRADDTYPFKALAGVGVVFKLLSAIEGDAQKILEEYGDLIALGTVSDVMPIVGENRLIVSEGLKVISAMQNKGLSALMKSTGIIKYGKIYRKINAATLGFVLGPRLNAAGRIAKAEYAVHLLLEEDEIAADKKAENLCEINDLRRETESKIYISAKKLLPEQEESAVLVCGGEGWHQGVIGIVASRISEKTAKPAVLLSYDGEIAKGSARSVKGFSIIDAFSYCSDLLIEYGGHELAAGLSLKRDKVEDFRQRLSEYAKDKLSEEPDRVLEIDLECDVDDINIESVNEILKLEPFGQGNLQPLFLIKDAVLESVIPISNGAHVKLGVSAIRGRAKSNILTALYFGMPETEFDFRVGERCDIAFAVDINEFNGNINAQLLIKGMRKAVHRKNVPSIPIFRQFYRFLRDRTDKNGCIEFDDTKVFSDFTADEEDIALMLAVFEEKELIEYNCDIKKSKIRLLPFEGKVDIENSKILTDAQQFEKK